MKIAAHPGLYDPGDGLPKIRGTRCGARLGLAHMVGVGAVCLVHILARRD